MRQVQFGVATTSEDQFAGILGIGYGEGVNTRYKNLVDELAAQGVTRTKAFSLGLGSKDEQEGAIIFGGVDSSKFSGPLARLPIVPADQSPDGVARYWVGMNSISLTPPSRRTRTYQNSSMPVFLDSGATLTLLPAGLADNIASDFGSPGIDANGFYPVSCTLVNLNGTLDFDFDGVKIKVPYKEMIRELRTTPPVCYLGIVPNSDFTLLGDTFLRSAYSTLEWKLGRNKTNEVRSRVRSRHQVRLPRPVRQLRHEHAAHHPAPGHRRRPRRVPAPRGHHRRPAGRERDHERPGRGHGHGRRLQLGGGIRLDPPDRPHPGHVRPPVVGLHVRGRGVDAERPRDAVRHRLGGDVVYVGNELVVTGKKRNGVHVGKNALVLGYVLRKFTRHHERVWTNEHLALWNGGTSLFFFTSILLHDGTDTCLLGAWDAASIV